MENCFEISILKFLKNEMKIFSQFKFVLKQKRKILQLIDYV